MTYQVHCAKCGHGFQFEDLSAFGPGGLRLTCPFCSVTLSNDAVQKWDPPKLDPGSVKREAGDDQAIILTQVERAGGHASNLAGRWEVVILTGHVPSYETEVSNVEIVPMAPPEEPRDQWGRTIRPPLDDISAAEARRLLALGLEDESDENDLVASQERLRETIDALGVAIVDGFRELALAAITTSPLKPMPISAEAEATLRQIVEMVRYSRSSASGAAGEETGGPA